MDLKDKNNYGNWTRFIKSFIYAWSGLKNVVKNEQNMRIHLFISIIVISMSFILSISVTHKLILFVVVGIVLSLEVMNTAIERTVDLVTEEYHPLAELAKDISAAAVLLFSIVAVIIGIVIFYQPLIDFLTKGSELLL